MSQWKPISTAPKDGSYVILYVPDEDSELTIACWIYGDWRSWVWSEDCWQNVLNPTHWMPLPEPPKK